jgi:hypothetical protein
MRVIGWIVAMGASATMGSCWGQSPAAHPASGCGADAPMMQALWAEVRSLRAELLEDRRAMQQAKVADLQRQLESIEGQQRHFDQERSAKERQLAEVETELTQPNLDNNERAELESQKVQLLSVPPGPPPVVQNVLSQREARVRDLLAEQEQRAQALDQLARQLSAGAQ